MTTMPNKTLYGYFDVRRATTTLLAKTAMTAAKTAGLTCLKDTHDLDDSLDEYDDDEDDDDDDDKRDLLRRLGRPAGDEDFVGA